MMSWSVVLAALPVIAPAVVLIVAEMRSARREGLGPVDRNALSDARA